MNLNQSFNVFEVIISYAIDKIDTLTGHDVVIKKLNLNEDVFFKSLYVHRKTPEDKLHNFIKTSQQPIIVYGFPGTGKTSLVTSVIRDFTIKDNALVFKFDFASMDQIIAPIKGSDNFDYQKWHDEKINSKINTVFIREKITNKDIVSFFLEDRFFEYQFEKPIDEIRMKLFDQYQSESVEINLCEWYLGKVAEKNIKILELTDKLIDQLSPHHKLMFLSFQDIKNLRKLIIFYDNIDSILMDDIRYGFLGFIRQYCGIIGKFVNVIISARYSSIANQREPDYGAHSFNRLPIDYLDFIEESLFKKKINEREKMQGKKCSLVLQERIKKLCVASARSKFALAIIKKRAKYIEDNRAQINTVLNLTDIDLQVFEELCTIFIKCRILNDTLLELSNHDRHWMFRHLVSFIDYLVNTLKIEPSDLGDSEREQHFMLESYFYNWALENEKINITNFDIVKSTENWYLHKKEIGCSIQHIILSVIYNMTNQYRGANSYIFRATVKGICDKCGLLGLKPEIVKSTIFGLYKKDILWLGLIETSNFHKIIDETDLEDFDRIWLTPRACHLLEYISNKFIYMINLYRKNTISNNSIPFDYDDRMPITNETIFFNLTYLCRLGKMHLQALSLIKEMLVKLGYSDWFEFYKKEFCINSINSDDLEEFFGELILNNILESHIKFLIRQRHIEEYDFITNEMIDQYNNLKTEFNACIKKLRDGLMEMETFEKYEFASVDLSIF